MIAWGMQDAVCTLIGNSVGEGNIQKGKKYLRLTTTTAIFVTALISTLLFVLRSDIVLLYTSEPTVADFTSSNMFLLSIFHLSDGV